MKKLLALFLVLVAFPAEAGVLGTSAGGKIVAPLIDLNQKWQGMGQGMQMTVQGFNSANLRSSLNRTRHYSNVAFRYFRVVIPVSYSTNGAGLADALYSGAEATLSFQVGFEYPYALANSGLAARTPVTWSGANYFTYNNSGWTGPGYIVSDVIDAGQTLPAGAKFGLWTTIELPSAAANAVPYTMNCTNYLERYIGSAGSSSSQIAALGGSSDAALTATSIAHTGTSQSGYSNCFTPAYLLIAVPASTKMVAGHADSIGYGIGEGTNSADTNGDALGDANGNMGWMARWVIESLGMNFVNFGRGSDRANYLATSANWQYRQQLLQLANPTDVLEENALNDLSAGRTVAQLLADLQTVYGIIAGLLPNARIVQTATTYVASSSDSFMTTGNQTPATFFGNSASRRGTFNDTYVRTAHSALGTVGFVDPNPALESGYVEGSAGTETSIWAVNGTANYLTTDGTHPDSNGATRAAANIQAFDASGNPVANPF
jgi:hypothetical protein